MIQSGPPRIELVTRPIPVLTQRHYLSAGQRSNAEQHLPAFAGHHLLPAEQLGIPCLAAIKIGDGKRNVRHASKSRHLTSFSSSTVSGHQYSAKKWLASRRLHRVLVAMRP